MLTETHTIVILNTRAFSHVARSRISPVRSGLLQAEYISDAHARVSECERRLRVNQGASIVSSGKMFKQNIHFTHITYCLRCIILTIRLSVFTNQKVSFQMIYSTLLDTEPISSSITLCPNVFAVS